MKLLIESILTTILFVILIPGIFRVINKKSYWKLIAIHAISFFIILFVVKNIIHSGIEGLDNQTQNKTQFNECKISKDSIVEKKVKTIGDAIDNDSNPTSIHLQIKPPKNFSDVSLLEWDGTCKNGQIMDNNVTDGKVLFLENRYIVYSDNSDFIFNTTSDGLKAMEFYNKKAYKVNLNNIFDSTKINNIIVGIRKNLTDPDTGKYTKDRKTFVGDLIGLRKGTIITLLPNEKTKGIDFNSLVGLKKFGKTVNVYKTEKDFCGSCDNPASGLFVKSVNNEGKIKTCNIEFSISLTKEKPEIKDVDILATIKQSDIIDKHWMDVNNLQSE